jgi:membrane protein involved in colicin uptake
MVAALAFESPKAHQKSWRWPGGGRQRAEKVMFAAPTTHERHSVESTQTRPEAPAAGAAAGAAERCDEEAAVAAAVEAEAAAAEAERCDDVVGGGNGGAALASAGSADEAGAAASSTAAATAAKTQRLGRGGIVGARRFCFQDLFGGSWTKPWPLSLSLSLSTPSPLNFVRDSGSAKLFP